MCVFVFVCVRASAFYKHTKEGQALTHLRISYVSICRFACMCVLQLFMTQYKTEGEALTHLWIVCVPCVSVCPCVRALAFYVAAYKRGRGIYALVDFLRGLLSWPVHPQLGLPICHRWVGSVFLILIHFILLCWLLSRPVQCTSSSGFTDLPLVSRTSPHNFDSFLFFYVGSYRGLYILN